MNLISLVIVRGYPERNSDRANRRICPSMWNKIHKEMKRQKEKKKRKNTHIGRPGNKTRALVPIQAAGAEIQAQESPQKQTQHAMQMTQITRMPILITSRFSLTGSGEQRRGPRG